jgi:hypothetical protein
MRDRDAERRRHADAGGDARNDLHLDAVGEKRLQLFAAAAEDERIATLQPGYGFSLTCVLDEQLFDEDLRGRLATCSLADLNDSRIGARVREAAAVHERIDEHHVGEAEDARRLERHQLGIARPGADEVGLAAHVPSRNKKAQSHRNGFANRMPRVLPAKSGRNHAAPAPPWGVGRVDAP